MNTQDNLEKIRQHYLAFQSGDIPGALAIMAEQVDFLSPVTHNPTKEITWAKPRFSRREVAAFFKKLGEKMAVEKMEIFSFTAQDKRVVVEGRNAGTVRETGKRYVHDWVTIFTFEQDKVIKCRHYYDTADLLAAF